LSTPETSKKVLLIAAVCMNVNAGLQAALGDEQVITWDDAPEEIRASTVQGVLYHLENPNVTPEQSHASWLAAREAAGWVLGEVKDLKAKTHPCMLPFDQLPIMQKAKDHIFKATVDALKNLPLERLEEVTTTATAAAQAPMAVIGSAAAPSSPTVMLDPAGFTPITYIGRRETYREGTYGSGLVFQRGETKLVPNALAAKLLQHPDVYRLGKIEQSAAALAPEAAPKATQAEKDVEEERMQDHRDSVMRMDSKAALAEFAKTNFNMELDKRKTVAALQTEVIQLIDRFGVSQ
jgi:hypothetical protein